MFFAQKHLILVQKIGYGFGGYPPPPLYGFFFSEKGLTDLGGTPAPPFTDKICKVVFEGLPRGKGQILLRGGGTPQIIKPLFADFFTPQIRNLFFGPKSGVF